MQEVNADIGVIVSEALPKEYLKYGISQGVYICSPSESKALSHVFRQLIIIHHRDIKDNDNTFQIKQVTWIPPSYPQEAVIVIPASLTH